MIVICIVLVIIAAVITTICVFTYKKRQKRRNQTDLSVNYYAKHIARAQQQHAKKPYKKRTGKQQLVAEMVEGANSKNKHTVI